MSGNRERIHRLAEKEYTDAFVHYSRQSVRAALRFEDAVEAGLDVIMRTPQRCPRVTEKHRWLLLRPFPYALVFLETADGPYVVSVAHAKRRFGFWRRRKVEAAR